MAEIRRKGNDTILVADGKDAQISGLKAGAEYGISRAAEGIFVLVESGRAMQKPATGNSAEGPAKPQSDKAMVSAGQAKPGQHGQDADEAEQKIIGLLRKLPPRDRMESWFEKKLNAEEKAKFAEMLAQGKIRKYKSSEVFRKALYTVAAKAEAKKTAQKFDNNEKPFQDYTLEKDGFLVVRNEERAKALSEELRDKIKSGEIKGIRAFTGEFYIVRSELLEVAEAKVLSELKKEKSSQLESISQKTGLTKTACKVALEFLKDEGQAIEKRKDLYQYIE